MCVQLYFFYLLTSLYVAYAHRIIHNSVLMPLLVELLYYSELYLVEYTLTQYPHGYAAWYTKAGIWKQFSFVWIVMIFAVNGFNLLLK